MEQLLRERFAADTVVLTGSGTQALQLAITATGAGTTPPHVALPAYSCYDLISAAVGSGARVSFYDVDATTLTPNLDSLERCLSGGARALVAGYLYGYPLPWAGLRLLADHHDALLIEDAAQGLGSVGDGVPAGTAGDLTVLSFGRGKGWTGGGGGALLARGVLRPELSKLPAGTGRTKPAVATLAAWLLGRPSLYTLPSSIPQLGLGRTVYHPPVPPRSISMFSAALAARTHGPAFEAVAERREQAARWARAIHDADPLEERVLPCRPRGGPESASWLRFATRLAGPGPDSATWTHLRRLGVESGYPVPLPRLPETDDVRSDAHPEFPGAESLAETLLTFPTHHWVKEEDVREVVALLTA